MNVKSCTLLSRDSMRVALISKVRTTLPHDAAGHAKYPCAKLSLCQKYSFDYCVVVGNQGFSNALRNIACHFR